MIVNQLAHHEKLEWETDELDYKQAKELQVLNERGRYKYNMIYWNGILRRRTQSRLPKTGQKMY